MGLRRCTAWSVGLAAGWLSVGMAFAQDSGGSLVLVNTDQPARCQIRGGPAAIAPLVARLQPGSYQVECVAMVQGVKLRRTTTIQVAAGRHLQVTLGMLGKVVP